MQKVKSAVQKTCVIALVAVMGFLPLHVFAASNTVPEARVSFTFDDGLSSALTKAAPTLSKYNIQGTEYVTTKCIGTTGTCPADKKASYMTWAQVKKLRDTYGWEIGAHTQNHYPLSTLSVAKQEAEISGSKQDLTAHGMSPTSFATPEGDYTQATLQLIAKYFTSHRGFWDVGANTWPYNDYLIKDIQVQVGVSVASVKAQIDSAIANKQWVVLVFHDIKDKPSTNPSSYHYSTANLDAIAAYVAQKQKAGKVTTGRVTESLATGQNLLANGNFDTGISNGWQTDTPGTVQANTAGTGSMPTSQSSVKLTSSAQNSHLFSPKVAVSSSNVYLYKTYLSVRQIARGEVGFYIDEYDANGQWISGQWKGAEPTVFTENVNFTYQPSSFAVSSASLQIYTTANSGATAYVDNVQMIHLRQEAVTPPANIAPNGTFDAGLSQGWTTDAPANVTLDSSNHGSPANALHSIKMSADTNPVHLFSPLVAVSSSRTYSLAAFNNIVANSGEVGFYIDEYDANGQWVSGQWKTGITSTAVGDTTMLYTPTNSNVTSARFQVYAQGAGTTVYIDHIRWYQL